MNSMQSHSRSSHIASRTPPVQRWRLWVLGACVGLPLLVFGATGALWLYEHHWLKWVGLAFLCGEALFLWLVRRWSRTDAALLPQPSTVVPPTFAPRDEVAWTLVQTYLDRIERGDILLEGVEQFLSLGREILERIAAYYNPDNREPLLAIQVPCYFVLWKKRRMI